MIENLEHLRDVRVTRFQSSAWLAVVLLLLMPVVVGLLLVVASEGLGGAVMGWVILLLFVLLLLTWLGLLGCKLHARDAGAIPLLVVTMGFLGLLVAFFADTL